MHTRKASWRSANLTKDIILVFGLLVAVPVHGQKLGGDVDIPVGHTDETLCDSAATTCVETASVAGQITLDAAGGTVDFNCSGGVDCTQVVTGGPGQTAVQVQWNDNSDVSLMSWIPSVDGGEIQFGTVGADTKIVLGPNKLSFFSSGIFRFAVDDKLASASSPGPNLVFNPGADAPAYRNSSGDISGMGFPAEDQVAFYTNSLQALRLEDDGTDQFMVIVDDKTPASASATCTKGTFVWDVNFLYVCVATDTWKSSALSTF